VTLVPVRAFLAAVAAAVLCACAAAPGAGPAARAAPAAPASDVEVYAIRYGTLRSFPVSALVAGADTARRMDIALMVWLIRTTGPDGGRRNVLVDAGFYREAFLRRWKPADYRRPSDALGAVGLRAEDVTDVIVSHVHWDHLDGADLFPKARLWIQRAEYEHHVDAAGRVRDRAIDSTDAAMLAGLRAAGRVTLVDGDGVAVLPGVSVYTGGRHTFASQYVGVRTGRGVVVLASDNAYLYENLATGAAIAQTLDPASNVAAQARMARLAADPRLIVPGHDPAVFVRFPAPGGGVARIE
jgi:glyoxylase-like metal-dependent hydrolase (beta-lactamase superfamily II)